MMKFQRCKYAILLVILVIIPTLTACDVYRKIQDGKIPNYEVGIQAGANACRECHESQYEEWSEKSAHATATVNRPFLDFKAKFTSVFAFDAMMGEEMCYACHGSKVVNEGVNCETCHGIALPNDEDFEKTHETKYKPGLKKIRQADFCRYCHSMSNPVTGDLILSLYSEWERSSAGGKGITCQACHMKPRESGEAYHGFDSLSRNVEIYNDILEISDISIQFPEFELTVVNQVSGHAIPASGPSRIMVMEISFRDAKGSEVYKSDQTFGKYYDLMPVFGVMPYRLKENTQLQSDEARLVKITLPSKLQGKISELMIVMRFYDVSDDHQGDINKAHTISKPFFEKRVIL
jgi:hypothetical protein